MDRQSALKLKSQLQASADEWRKFSKESDREYKQLLKELSPLLHRGEISLERYVELIDFARAAHFEELKRYAREFDALKLIQEECEV